MSETCPGCGKRMFICAGCGREFTTETAVNDMEAEFKDHYGHSMADSDEEIVSTCDYCWEQILNYKKINNLIQK